ncbi:MAG: acylphosphatase [Spirochaetaceae bacterium]|nr:acylphosphatase [Spirochaetaceae bacterium]
MKAKPITALHARITGRVQGVAFRYYAQSEAARLGVTGWIRNSEDGSVEVWAEGIEENVINFLDWLHKGSPHARVDKVRSDICPPQKTYKSFSIQADDGT